MIDKVTEKGKDGEVYSGACTCLKGLEAYNQLKSIKFEYIYRCRALSIENGEETDNKYLQSLWKRGYIDMEMEDVDIDILRKDKFSIFLDEDSSYLLWLCYCIRYQGKSLLSYMVPFIDKISGITRGGINTYKRNGWAVHVLYVYQLVNFNFAHGEIPKAVKWNFDAEKIFQYFNKIYCKLSNNAKFALKTACFIHDIGVQIAVNNHEVLGIPLVEESLDVLDYSKENLELAGVTLTRNELVQFLQQVVGNHQLINQVSAEVSDYIIQKKIIEIASKMTTDHLKEMFQNEFSDIMFLLGAADMMAVDDLLLSEVKFSEMKEAEEYIQSLIRGGSYKRDNMTFGIRRLKCFANDQLKVMPDKEIQDIIRENGYQPNQVLSFMYDIQSVSYGIAAVKPLNSMELSVKFICLLYSIISREKQNYEKVAARIDSGFDEEYVRVMLEQPVEKVASELRFDISLEGDIVIYTFYFDRR